MDPRPDQEPPVFVLDGAGFATLEQFFDQLTQIMNLSPHWGRNLDALNDVLSGAMGAPEARFVLEWRNAEFSRARLGYPETARQLDLRLRRCHPLNVPQ